MGGGRGGRGFCNKDLVKKVEIFIAQFSLELLGSASNLLQYLSLGCLGRETEFPEPPGYFNFI